MWGGSVSDYLAKHYSKGICNDIDRNLMNFYWVAYNKEDELKQYIYNNRASLEFDQVNNFKHELSNESNDLIRAFKYYCCIFNGYSGKPYETITRYNLNKFKTRKIEKDFDKIRTTLSKCELSSTDYHNLQGNNKLFYCDPPYFKVGKNTYYGYKGENHKEFDHYEFARWIKEIGKTNYFIISYEDSDEIRELYKNYNIITIDKKSVYYDSKEKITKSKGTNEVLIMNY